MSTDFDHDLHLDRERDVERYTELDEDALHAQRRDRSREDRDVAAAQRAESDWWAARGGHPAPTPYPEGGHECTCTPGEPCADTGCEVCWRTHGCPAAADLTAADEHALGRAQELDELAARHDLVVERVTQGRMCHCTDGRHAELPPGQAATVWYWSADLPQVASCRVFYGADAHAIHRDVTVLATPPQVVTP